MYDPLDVCISVLLFTNLFRTYSDEGLKIRKVGTDEIYDEAIDIADASYTYEEIDIPIEDYSDIEESYKRL